MTQNRTGGSFRIPVSIPLSHWSYQRSISLWNALTGRSRWAGAASSSFLCAVLKLLLAAPAHQLLVRSLEIAKPVLGPVEMRLIRVAVPARAGIGRDVDLREFRPAFFDRRLLVVGIDENVEVLPLERQNVVDV